MRKTLNTTTVLLPNNKVAEANTVEFQVRGAGRAIQLGITVDGKAAVDTLGYIDRSSHPDYTHVFTPSETLYAKGLRAVRGTLSDARTAAIVAAGYRLGGLTAEMASRI